MSLRGKRCGGLENAEPWQLLAGSGSGRIAGRQSAELGAGFDAGWTQGWCERWPLNGVATGKRPIAFLLYLVLGVGAWFTLDENKICVYGRQVLLELALVPLIDAGRLPALTHRSGCEGGEDSPGFRARIVEDAR